MNDADILAYVKAAARMLALPLDEARVQAVAEHLGRTALMAGQLEGFSMPLAEEMSETFCPAKFPASDDEEDDAERGLGDAT